MISTLTPPITPVLPTVTLHGIRIHALTEIQTIQTMMDRLTRNEGGWIVTDRFDVVHGGKPVGLGR